MGVACPISPPRLTFRSYSTLAKHTNHNPRTHTQLPKGGGAPTTTLNYTCTSPRVSKHCQYRRRGSLPPTAVPSVVQTGSPHRSRQSSVHCIVGTPRRRHSAAITGRVLTGHDGLIITIKSTTAIAVHAVSTATVRTCVHHQHPHTSTMPHNRTNRAGKPHHTRPRDTRHII